MLVPDRYPIHGFERSNERKRRRTMNSPSIRWAPVLLAAPLAAAAISGVPAHAAQAASTTSSATRAGIATGAHSATPQARDDGQAAANVRLAGYESRSYIRRGNCSAWVYTKKSRGHWYAKGVVRSAGKYAPHCQMYLSRRHGSGAYKPVSESYIASRETRATGYHWDDRGYKARVCLSNLDRGDQKFYCGTGV
jgi:hypothetical protein